MQKWAIHHAFAFNSILKELYSILSSHLGLTLFLPTKKWQLAEHDVKL